MNGTYDVVYPYGQGRYQYQVKPSDDVVSDFLESNDYAILKSNARVHDSDFGWVQFFDKETYIKGGMENENFKVSWLQRTKKDIIDILHLVIK